MRERERERERGGGRKAMILPQYFFFKLKIVKHKINPFKKFFA